MTAATYLGLERDTRSVQVLTLHARWFHVTQRYYRRCPGGSNLLEFAWRSLEIAWGRDCARAVMRLEGFGRWVEKVHPEASTGDRDEWVTSEDLANIWGTSPIKLFKPPVFQDKRRHPPTLRRPRPSPLSGRGPWAEGPCRLTREGWCKPWLTEALGEDQPERVWSRREVEEILAERAVRMLVRSNSSESSLAQDR